ncbi:hypothetical protein [Marinifilum sp.]|uniref:hypothetical protein n=1 Tax=Marinifilum sp. TaxID=2033137 RepID=UPI003BA9B74D
MTEKECYELLLEKYTAIRKEDVKSPNLPVETAINEALKLNQNAMQDKDQLIKTDIDLVLIDELETRAFGCKYAQILWDEVFKGKSDAEGEWKVLAPKAYDLRDTLLHYCRFAYRNDKDLKDRVDRIAEGNGHDDLAMDLAYLANLGKGNPDQLTANSIDMALFDQAESMSHECSDLLAGVHGAKTANATSAKDMRDRAYTILKEAVDAVRTAGRFVFWRDEERIELYGSEYFRELRAKNKTDKEKLEA